MPRFSYYLHALCLALLVLATKAHAQLPAYCRQVVIGVAPNDKSSRVTLLMMEKRNGTWQPITRTWSGRLGRNGLAWGLGVHAPQRGIQKQEGDGRSPKGIFPIGAAYGYAPKIMKHPALPYTRITQHDLWVEDSNSSYYNCHLRIPHLPSNTWEKKAQMRQNDHAHSLKLFIAHNAPTAQRRAVPHAGSSIFFHIWRRNGKAATAGCTVMSESKLKLLISQINPSLRPHYILLSKAEYERLDTLWNLPELN